jgi:hypothetical protein
MFNFDETGFMMGVISSQLVVTSSEMPGKRKTVQPGNREWVTVIQGVNAAGWAIPPFVIFAGKVLISSWYNDVPRDWVISVSPNGWTSNEHAIAWLKHFNKHTRARTVGTHRLLIVDGHKSHALFEFQEYCREEKIITLCMPPHSSHLLQPLHVGCFSLLKRAYRDEISGLARNYTNHISKEAFLPAFMAAYRGTRRNHPPGVTIHPNTKTAAQLEAIELRTIAINAIFSVTELCRPCLIYTAIYILLGAWLLGRVVIEMVAGLLQHLKSLHHPEAAQQLSSLKLLWQKPWGYASYHFGTFFELVEVVVEPCELLLVRPAQQPS